MPGSGQGRVGGREAYVLADSAVMSVSVVFVKVLRLASVQPVPGVIRSNLGDVTSRVLVVC